MSEVAFDGDAVAVSRYWKRFQKLIAKEEQLGRQLMILQGDQILVERLPKLELKTKSGLIIPGVNTHVDTAKDRMTEFGLVLKVGPGDVLSDGSRAIMETKVGDVILLPANVFWYSAFGHISDYDQYSLGRLRDSQVPMWFREYKLAFEIINGLHEDEVIDKPVFVDGVQIELPMGGEP